MENNIFSKSENFTQEYCCTIVRINELIPIEGADNIAQTIVNGESIVVRKDQVHEGDVLIYASNETQLHEGFLSANNLFDVEACEKNSNYDDVKESIERKEMLKTSIASTNKLITKMNSAVLKNVTKQMENFVHKYEKSFVPSSENDLKAKTEEFIKLERKRMNDARDEVDQLKATIKSKCGFFNKYGRVRLIRLKGIPSFGYLFTIQELGNWLNERVMGVNLEEHVGEDFDTVCGELFVKAYVPPIKNKKTRVGHSLADKRSRKAEKRFDRLVEGQFKFHYVTNPLGKNMHLFNPNTVVTISVKAHGCVERNTIVDTMEYGELSIGEIVDNKKECHIKAFDTDTNTIVYVPIDNFYMIPNDGEWYEIELENGKKIIITGNNPIWLPDLGVYRRVDELNGDEKILFSED